MFYVADVQIEWDLGHDALNAFLMKDTLLAFFPMVGEKQWRIVGTFPEEFAKDEGEVLYEEIEERINKIPSCNWIDTKAIGSRPIRCYRM